ncbi:uncharacterized protein LOC109836741 isoform X1 [Asparagus officinalis]|nr:uncharacterized protein LOC109836741 isoform X1 [Asparagus officinalis]
MDRGDGDQHENKGVLVSKFDPLVENFLASMDSIRELCGLPDEESFDASEIERFSSMITFLEEWEYFAYEPKTISFACEIGGGQFEEDIGEITLPPFSSAAVPKLENPPGEAMSLDSDFVLHAGGLVWAMDWCPRNQENSGNNLKCEYLAVTAHPPAHTAGSIYHKIGVPLTGRGIIQIWCLVSLEENAEILQGPREKRGRGRPKGSYENGPSKGNEELTVQRPRDRPEEKVEGRGRGRPKGTCKNRPLKGKEELTIRRPRGRPKGSGKRSGNKQSHAGEINLNQEMDLASSGDKLVPRMSNSGGASALETLVPKRRGRPRKKLVTSPSEDAPVSKDIVALPVSADLNENIETSMLNSRGRLGKKPISSADEGAQAFAVDPGRDVSAPSTSSGLGTYSGGREDCEHTVPMANGPDDGVLKKMCKGLNSCPVAITDDTTTQRKKRRVKDKECFVSHLNIDQHLSGDEHKEFAVVVAPTNDELILSKEMTERFHIPNHTALPKVVFCLAHMGEVAWDVKWRPVSSSDPVDRHRLGYLAVLLGDGSLEVWEVPDPSMVRIFHSSSHSSGTDPRFLQVKPIFRCSKVLFGDRQSIPLTLEWSPSAPHDLILAGCHDGTVALWKFSKQHSSQDMKPLLCFIADSVPIRSVSWAPDESDAESANLMVTAGHEGLKFWDIRDPYRPLWEFYPVQRFILSLEWLKDPRCLVMSLDDGTLRMLSLWKVVNDVLVTGEASSTVKQSGHHTYNCSHFAIWSCQVSRATGLAAYCTADGAARFFKLTVNAVEKDSSRYRQPHFLCGSLASDGRILKIKSQLSKDPLPNMPLKKVPTGMGDVALFSFLSDPNQARGGDNQTPPNANSKSKPRHNKNRSGSKEADPGQVPCQELITVETTEKTEEGSAQKNEGLPPKDVALHKVRWNMNKGSERWLCYGGAAGIIRCQKISLDIPQ